MPNGTAPQGQTTLLLVPGLLCDGELFAAQRDSLATRAAVEVFDPSPFGSIDEAARAMLASAPARFLLSGFSLGAWVALAAVVLAPARIRGLALMSCSPHTLAPQVREHLAGSIALLEAGRLDEYLTGAYPLYVAPARGEDAALRAVFDGMAHRVGAAAGARGTRALIGYAVDSAGLAAIACPAVVVGGAEDRRVTPAMHEELAAAIPGAELVLVPGSGHFTPLERPEDVTRALARLLERVAAGAPSA